MGVGVGVGDGVAVAIAVVDAVEERLELEVWVIKFEAEEILWLVLNVNSFLGNVD